LRYGVSRIGSSSALCQVGCYATIESDPEAIDAWTRQTRMNWTASGRRGKDTQVIHREPSPQESAASRFLVYKKKGRPLPAALLQGAFVSWGASRPRGV